MGGGTLDCITIETVGYTVDGTVRGEFRISHRDIAVPHRHTLSLTRTSTNRPEMRGGHRQQGGDIGPG